MAGIELRKWAVEQAVKAADGRALPDYDIVMEANKIVEFVAAEPPAAANKVQLAAWVTDLHRNVRGCGAALQERIFTSLKEAGLI